MIKQVTKYIASDGMEFDSRDEAVQYEGRSEIFKVFDECVLRMIYHETIHPRTFSKALLVRLASKGVHISFTKETDS